MALTGVADTAAAFGYCRPVVDAPVVPYRPAYCGNIANTNVPDSSTKLTTDLKQETVVDPRTVGLSGKDELDIVSIVTRESYLTTVDWATAAVPGDRLCTFAVTPCNWDEFNGGTNTEVHMTPACHISTMFQHWRGTMKYRFQIMASNFHKGRLQIQYDPYDSTENEFNVAYNRIVDISEEKDFTIEVGWGVPNTFLQCINPGISALQFRNTSTTLPFPTLATNTQNGQISIWVLNDLTVPNSVATSDVAINCFVSCGDDFEFINPQDTFADFQYFPDPTLAALTSGEKRTFPKPVSRMNFKEYQEYLESQKTTEPEPAPLDPQSGEDIIAEDTEETKEPSRPVTGMPDMSVAADADHTSPLSSICYGETIKSMRALMKRYTFYSFVPVDRGGSSLTINSTRQPNFPLQPGYAPDGINVTAAANDYNYVQQTYLCWLAPCFQGWRGGLRRKILAIPDGATPERPNGITIVERSAATGFGFVESSRKGFAYTGNLSQRMFFIENFLTGATGSQVTVLDQNPVLEIELPYHQEFRFTPTRDLQPNALPGVTFNSTHTVTTLASSTSNDSITNITYCAAGDDFSFFFYTNVPVCYYLPGFPVA
eukprot:NODE_143_length_2217_cov_87.012915_g116_i0.p1 GENE.NODE_143_length_2217_cov_87.012915_g116_i0~~NODE_143_length_2217_cov_87.012915_g116_i0.p1  ORF type:complete len:638 (-),score=-0.75 NODE_143_length_2217_cov_87.012915_g116_i0:304-2103(-)